MNKELIEKVKGMSVEELKTSWKSGDLYDTDELLLKVRDGIIETCDVLPKTLDEMGSGKLLSTHWYEQKYKGRGFIITYLGRIEDFEELSKKYLPYDVLIAYACESGAADKDLIKGFLSGKDSMPVEENQKHFILRISGTSGTLGGPVDKATIQIFPIVLEDLLEERLDGYCFTGIEEFSCPSEYPYQVHTREEVEENIEEFIKDNIDPNPIYGLEKFNTL